MKSTRKIPIIGDGTWTAVIPFALITSCFALWGFANDITTPLVKAFSKACGKEIPYEIKPRRAGDIDMCYADPSKALKVLGWKAERGLDEMCEDTWRWQSQNPNGYREA